MPLTNNPLPSIIGQRAVPIDVRQMFAQNQTFTASGPLAPNPATALGPTDIANNGALQIDLGPGRIDRFLAIDLRALKVSAGNETYLVTLLGSNDVAFAAGNVDELFTYSFVAASAGRFVPSLSAPTPVVPAPGKSNRRYVLPWTNQVGEYTHRYLQAYLTVGGTSPSITMSAWITTGE